MRSVVGSLFLVALLAACGDARNPPSTGNPSGDSTVTAVAAPPEPQPPFGWMPATEDSSRPAGTIGGGEQAHQAAAIIREWEIDVTPDTIRAGDVSIALQNRGERPHIVEVRGDRGGRWRSFPIPPGGTVTMTMPMAPGSYEVFSTTQAYVERGMHARLVVR